MKTEQKENRMKLRLEQKYNNKNRQFNVNRTKET